jgi:hypothetical protein
MGATADAGASDGKGEEPNGCVVDLDAYEETGKPVKHVEADNLEPILRR